MGRAERRAFERAQIGKRAGGGRKVRGFPESVEVGSEAPGLPVDGGGLVQAAPALPEAGRPSEGHLGGAEALELVRRARSSVARADARLAAAVAHARAASVSWSRIGAVLGLTGEAVRLRYRDGGPPPAALVTEDGSAADASGVRG